MNQAEEKISITGHKDSALLRLELVYATLGEVIGGHYWGIFFLGVVSLVWIFDLLKVFFFIVFMGLGLLVLVATDAILEHIRTHRRGFGLTWSYPPTLTKLVQLELARTIISVLIDSVGLVLAGIYTPTFWGVVLGAIIVSLGAGLNAYFTTSRAQQQRSIRDVR